MDEVFGEDNFIAVIPFRKKTMPFGGLFLEQMDDFILWYGKNKAATKYRRLFTTKDVQDDQDWVWYLDADGVQHRMNEQEAAAHANLPPNSRVYRLKSLEPSGEMAQGKFSYEFRGKLYGHPANGYGTTPEGMRALDRLNRLQPKGKFLNYRLLLEDYPVSALTTPWQDTVGADDKTYVVQTNSNVVKRCVLLSTDPGDLVLDPTCGSGTTATVAEQWGRRWITIDSSRVALALARARIMGARYPYYLLADSDIGKQKEAAINRVIPNQDETAGDVRQGFVYERVPHVTLRSITNDIEIEAIWNKWQPNLEPLLATLCTELKVQWKDWEVPRVASEGWTPTACKAHAAWQSMHDEFQREIEASVAAKAEFELLYDRPYEDKRTVRVAGPFTVESISPHRMLGVGSNDELIDPMELIRVNSGIDQSFPQMIIENLKTSGVQQARRDDKIVFSALAPWPGDLIAAEGRFIEGQDQGATERRGAIFIGPEFGTITRADLVAAAREAADAGFDVLIACGFNYEAYTTDFTKLGRLPVLKARMNADLHMSDDLKNTGKGNLFVIFGEPDITLLTDETDYLRLKINGVDVFHPSTGEVRSDGPEGIACWFVDTDYNEESFFVRQAYFLGANDPYDSLRRTLKAEIDADSWATLNSDTSRPFLKPKSGRIAVKVINHLGDEVMKVFRVA